MTASVRLRVWDLPLRLFHWLLVGAILMSIVTGQIGGDWMDWHGRVGLFVLGLLSFRLAWGLLGSTYARFSQFLPTPASLRAYLRGEWRGVGHNPLGALAVFAMLGLLLAQVLAGLFANDDIAFRGPLFALAGKDNSDRLTGLHEDIFNVLLPLLGLHVGAVLYHARVKKRELIRPMLSGFASADADLPPPRGGGPLSFLAAALLACGLVWLTASGTLVDRFGPPPPAASATPEW